MQRLRELPKMIILDLSGNPCSAAAPEDYRLYVIFNVRKLKVRRGPAGGAAAVLLSGACGAVHLLPVWARWMRNAESWACGGAVV